MSVALADRPADRTESRRRIGEPDVSVIIPVFNAMPYLRRCLDSVLDQTIGFRRLEVVAVDDGSQDGSAAELDHYADRWPEVITVVHEPQNSGGPALPCNRGLELARGRYVFFLGADDYLGPEALQRLVDKADDWGSDVIFGTMKGVGGRYVDQRIFARSERDLDFLSSPLPYALSNTKLFRRSVLERHGIRYALDLRVGSDQPFVIEALTHARRISVLDDYVYYYAVRRAEATNITYSASWRARLDDITAVIRHIADVVGPGPVRDAILARHFGSELDKLLRRQLPTLTPDEQREIVAGIDELADEFWTDELSRRVPPEARVRLQLARAGDLDRLLGVVAYQTDTPRPPVVLHGDAAYVWSPVFDPEGPERDWHELLGEAEVTDRLARSLLLERLGYQGDRLELQGRLGVIGGGEAVRLVLSPVKRSAPGRRRLDAEPAGPAWPVSVGSAPDGGPAFSASASLRDLSASGPQRFAVRVVVRVGSTYHDLPLRWSHGRRRTLLRRGLRVVAVTAWASDKRRLLLGLTPQSPPRALLTAIRRRIEPLAHRIENHSNQEDR